MESGNKSEDCGCNIGSKSGGKSGSKSGGKSGSKSGSKYGSKAGNQNTVNAPIKSELLKPKCPEKPCCPCPCPAEKCKVTLKTVQRLVEAENKDIELSELLSGITILDERKPKKKILSMYDASSKRMSQTKDTTDSNVNPEYLAYIMRSIENGLSMKTDPIEVYEHLFSKGNPDAPLVTVGPTADVKPEEDMVIPLSAPTVIDSRDPDLEKGARIENVISKAETAAAEAMAIENVDDLKVLLGGTLLDNEDSSNEENDNKETARDLLLEARAPFQTSAVLRGSTAPSWFPGYYVALPNTGLPAVESDPENILDEAWFQSQPLSLKLEEKGAKLIGS